MIEGKFDYITPFYNQHHNNKSLVENLDSFLGSYNICAKAIPFCSDTPPVSLFPGIPGRSRKIKILKKSDRVQLFRMTYSFKEGSDIKEEEGDFFIYEHPGYDRIYVALTIESNHFFRRAMLPFFDSHFPRIMMTFIPTDLSPKKERKYRNIRDQ